MEMGCVSVLEDCDLTCDAGVWECICDLMMINRCLSEQLTLAGHQRFGQSSEKAAYAGVSLFDFDEDAKKWSEAESGAPEDEAPEPPEEPETDARSCKRRPRAKRKDQLPENIPVEVREYTLSEEELTCPECGAQRVIIGRDATEQVVIIPAHAVLRRSIREVCACPNCNRTGEQAHVQKADMPLPPVPGSFAAPETLAWVIDQKYNLGLPLYRVSQALAAQDIRISRQTLSGWMMAGADLLRPVYDSLHAQLIAGDIIMADDTPLQVLHEPDKPAQSRSYEWVFRTGRFAPMQIILYHYEPRHTMDGVTDFLQGFSGWLQADGLPGYDQLPDTIRRTACLAHIRRRFHEALKAIPEKVRPGKLAQQGMSWCQALYALEQEIHDLSPEERWRIRQEQAVPLLDDFEAWLQEEVRYAGKTKTGDAVRYALGQFPNLRNCLEDGRLAIDNNLTEAGGIKPFVMGRKAWLFSNTPRGAEASSILQRIVQTAKANGLVPVRYLTMLMEELPNVLDRSDPDWIVPFLPSKQKPQPDQ